MLACPNCGTEMMAQTAQMYTVQALWTRNKSEIKDAEYDEFYKYIGHDSEAPLYRLHFNDHGRPHFHAVTADDRVTIDIETLQLVKGSMPR